MSDTIIDGIRRGQSWVLEGSVDVFEASLRQIVTEGVSPHPKIVIADPYLILDCNIPSTPEDVDMLKKDGFLEAETNDKFTPSEHVFDSHYHRTVGCLARNGKITISPGGTGGNIAVNLSRLAGESGADILFLGAVPDGDPAVYKRPHDALDSANITEVENITGRHLSPAISLVFSLEKRKVILKKPVQDIHEWLNPQILVLASVQKAFREADLVLTTLNMRDVASGLVDGIFKERWERGAMSALTLPTDRKCAIHNAGLIDWYSASCNVLLGNETEAKNVFGDRPLPEIFERISHNFREGVLATHCHGLRDPVALITLGKDGACLVTPAGWKHYPAISNPLIVNPAGAGDSCFAAFLRAYVGGLSLDDCVGGGQSLGWAVLGINQTHYVDPLAGIALSNPELAKRYARIGKSLEFPYRPDEAQPSAACVL